MRLHGLLEGKVCIRMQSMWQTRGFWGQVVSNRWTGLLDWIAGLDCWTGLLDWILKKDIRLACKTACVVKTYASQGHTDVAEPRNEVQGSPLI